MRPAKGKTYQDYTFALSIPLELDVDGLAFLKMEHLSWLLLLALAWWRLANGSPILHGETTSLTLYSSLHERRGWQAPIMRSSRDGASWSCTSLLLTPFGLCLEDTYDELYLLLQDTLAKGSTLTWPICGSLFEHLGHHLILFTFFFSKPWSQHMVQALPMDNSYKYNLIQALVHRDCH